METHTRKPPPGAYRHRLCLCCYADGCAADFFFNQEDGSVRVAPCDRCKKETLTAVYRYTKRGKPMLHHYDEPFDPTDELTPEQLVIEPIKEATS